MDIKNGLKVSEWKDGKETCEEKIKALELIVQAQKRDLDILNTQKKEWEKEREELLRIKEQVKTFSISLSELLKVK